MKNTILFRLSILILIMLTFPYLAGAESGQEALFNEAGTAYSNGEYTQACDLYEQFINRYGYSASALYNLGNCYGMSGETGKAILNYERALRLDPGNSDIINNINVIKTKEGLFDPDLSTSEKLRNALTMNQWFIIGLVALSTLTLMVILWVRKDVSRKALISTTMLCLALLATSIVCTYEHYQTWQAYVVITPENRLIISPFAGAASVGDIKPGKKVYIIESHGDFVYVRDDSGRKGWLKRETVEPIIPGITS